MAHKDRITIEQAVSLLIEHAVTKETVTLPLLEAAGFVCAEDVKAKIPQPLFDRSAMDGYAIHSADLENASKETPVFLPVSDYLYAGSAPDTALAPGHAVRIPSCAGSPLQYRASKGGLFRKIRFSADAACFPKLLSLFSPYDNVREFPCTGNWLCMVVSDGSAPGASAGALAY